MRHGSGYGDAVALPRKHVARALKPRDVAGAGHRDARLRTMGSPQREVDELPPPAHTHTTRGFGRYHRLKLDRVDDEALDELPFDHGRAHLEDRLVGEYDGSFRHRAHRARESETAQALQQSVGKPPSGP